MSRFIWVISSEVAENWPAFVYMGLTIVFSLCFLRERRTETRMVKEIADVLNDRIRARFDRLEGMLSHRHGDSATQSAERRSHNSVRE
jgi:hypothetical protein